MYFSLHSSAFKDMLTTAKLAMVSRSTLPILHSLHCEVAPDGMTLVVTATDLDITLVQTIALPEQGTPGIACLDFKALAAVRPERNTPVRIQVPPFASEGSDNDARLHYVSAGHSATAAISLADPAQFPPVSAPPPEDYTCLLPGRTLTAIAAAVPFISADPTREILTGALLTPEEGGSVVATDGRRLIQIRTKATPVRCVFPSKLCMAVARLQPASAACAIRSEVPEGWREPRGVEASLRMGYITIHARLVDGSFPNFKQVIPTDCTSALTLSDPAAIASWLMALPEPEKGNRVTLVPRAPHFVDFIHDRGRITATAYLQNEPPYIAFNPRFLAAVLVSGSSSGINGTLHLTDAMSPGLFRGHNMLAVLMPMRAPELEPPVNSGKSLETTAAV